MYPAKKPEYIQNIQQDATITINYCTYLVVDMSEVGPNVRRYGWTHTLILRKVSGKKFYSATYNNQTGLLSKVL